jgi:hypothetical protein
MQKELKMSLPAADDLFSTQEERDDASREKVVFIPRSEIDGFPDHPFQVRVDESMLALAESVKAVGVQTPAIVRRKEDGRYEYVAGHRRDKACELAGIDTMPCVVRQMSRDEAIVAMVEWTAQRKNICNFKGRSGSAIWFDAYLTHNAAKQGKTPRHNTRHYAEVETKRGRGNQPSPALFRRGFCLCGFRFACGRSWRA